MLDPSKFTAWHAGYTTATEYTNPYAIGVEVHYSPGEGNWTGYMWDAITGLARLHSSLELVTHRRVAYPSGRKKDPSGVTDETFAYWVKNYKSAYTLYKTNTKVNVRIGASRQTPILSVLPNDFCVFGFDSDVIHGESINGNDRWVYAIGLGYIHSSLLTKQ